jgi:hypothetical protein
MAPKRKKKEETLSKETGTAHVGKGVGKKLAIYVPREDEFVLEELEKLRTARARAGYRTSLSYELIRLTKLGLRHPEAQKL